MYDIFTLKDFSFPKDFFWGSGYAGHQVEGNNTNNNIWKEEHLKEFDHIFREKSGMACNSYELYRKDIDIAKALGHEAFRTSIEWCRIEPNEGEFDEKALNHYIDLFKYAKEQGLKTFATLVHNTWPLWFDKLGHFTNLDNRKHFEKYLNYLIPKIAPYVDYYNVLNEFNSYGFKINCTKFHALGYHTIKQYTDAPVSSAHALVHYMPYRPYDKLDNILAQYNDFYRNEFFFHAMRTGELLLPFTDGEFDADVKNTVDYWSINCYTRNMTDSRKKTAAGKRYDYKQMKMIDEDFYLEEMHPEIIFANMDRLRDKPVIITENGCSCDNDDLRIVYLSLYLSALSEAIRTGVDVRGYLYWSLMDNYEWGSYKPRFGLCDVDFKTFERTPKRSAYFYKDIIENNGFSQEILRKYLKELPTIHKID